MEQPFDVQLAGYTGHPKNHQENHPGITKDKQLRNATETKAQKMRPEEDGRYKSHFRREPPIYLYATSVYKR
jgi:hypothetical protein